VMKAFSRSRVIPGYPWALTRGPPKSEFTSDSALEEAVSSELVSEAKFPASWENTGNFRYYAATAISQKAA
jgi:hypothetical protein